VSCCERTPLTLAPCNGTAAPTAVVMLDLRGFGLRGRLPPALASLPHLQAIDVGDNPGLTGRLPEGLQDLSQLLWLSVRVGGCQWVWVCAGCNDH